MLISKVEFRDWLQTMRLYDVVGKGGATTGCPIYHFLCHQHGHDQTISVFPERYCIGGYWHNLPQWAVNFTKHLDERFHTGAVILSYEALEILR